MKSAFGGGSREERDRLQRGLAGRELQDTPSRERIERGGELFAAGGGVGYRERGPEYERESHAQRPSSNRDEELRQRRDLPSQEEQLRQQQLRERQQLYDREVQYERERQQHQQELERTHERTRQQQIQREKELQRRRQEEEGERRQQDNERRRQAEQQERERKRELEERRQYEQQKQREAALYKEREREQKTSSHSDYPPQSSARDYYSLSSPHRSEARGPGSDLGSKIRYWVGAPPETRPVASGRSIHADY